MLKFLRKYNKWILVIGGGFLMVSFLLPQAIQQCAADPSKRTIAYLAGQRITARDYDEAARELLIVGRFIGEQQLELLLTADGPDQVPHWIMLVRQAREAGFLAEGEDDRAIIDARREQVVNSLLQAYRDAKMRFTFASFSGGLTPEQRDELLSIPGLETEAALQNLSLEQAAFAQWAVEQANLVAPNLVEGQVRSLSSALRVADEDIHAALSAFNGVQRMFNAYVGVARLSDRQSIAAAKRLLDTALVDYVFLVGGKGSIELPDVTDAEVDAHVAAFRDVERGAGEHGFGYIRPARVKFEYLKIDRAAVESLVEVDPVEANVRYRRDRARFPGTFAQERLTIERELKQERVSQVLDRIQQVIRAETLAQTSRLAPDGKFKVLPDDWESMRPRMEAVAAAVQQQIRDAEGLAIPFPEVRILNVRWSTAEDLAAMEGIGQASLSLANRSIPFAELAMQTRELEGAGPVALQTSVPFVEQPLLDFAGNRYYFTILDARKTSPPDSPDEVRELARDDLRKLRAFRELERRVPELRSIVNSHGLQGVADMFNSPWEERFPPLTAPPPPDSQFAVTTGVRVAEEGQADPRLGLPSVRDSIIAIGRKYPSIGALAAAPREETHAIAPVPRELGVVVAGVGSVSPVTVEAFRMREPSIVQNTLITELMGNEKELAAALKPFAFETLAERMSWRELRPRATPEGGDS